MDARDTSGAAVPVMWKHSDSEVGLTKREYYAAHVLPAVINRFLDGAVDAGTPFEEALQGAANLSRDGADALLAALAEADDA